MNFLLLVILPLRKEEIVIDIQISYYCPMLNKPDKLFLTVFFLFFSIITIQSQNFSDPLIFLGGTLNEIIEHDFIPDEVFSSRGAAENEDNVVFYYENGFYLFLYANRIWQVRYDKNFDGNILDFQLGMDRADILGLRGSPLIEDDAFIVYEIEGKQYPVRIKFFFIDDKLDDLYIYRSDY